MDIETDPFIGITFSDLSLIALGFSPNLFVSPFPLFLVLFRGVFLLMFEFCGQHSRCRMWQASPLKNGWVADGYWR